MYTHLTEFHEYYSEHYILHYRPNSTAAREIEKIAALQEECFAHITAELQHEPSFLLHYILLDKPEEVGEMYRQYYDINVGPINGFASYPDTIVAVYNENLKCIGMHEDTHLIARMIGEPWEALLIEGLAMYMDQVWWGESNETWTARYVAENKYVSIIELLENDCFYDVPCEISYPIVGSFIRYLVEKLTMNVFLKEVYASEDDVEVCLKRLLQQKMSEIENSFLTWITEHQNN